MGELFRTGSSFLLLLWCGKEGSYLASVAGVAVDVERGEQGHELLFISAPEAEQQFIKDTEEGKEATTNKRKQQSTVETEEDATHEASRQVREIKTF